MDVSSINITARMCSQAMLIQFPRSAPLSAPVALYTPFKFCTFSFLCHTEQNLWSKHLWCGEQPPTFCHLMWFETQPCTEHWTLDILCLTLDIGHEALEMRQWTWAIGIGHWQPTPAGRLLPPPWPPAGRQATSLCSCCSACNNHSNLLECSTTLAQPLHILSALFAQHLNVLCESFSPWK